MLDFSYAELCDTGKRWYVYFNAFNPQTGKKDRVRYYLNRPKTEQTKRRTARAMINEINRKLDQGWNPFFAEKEIKQYATITQALDYALQLKLTFIRKSSIPNYNERIVTLKTWLTKRRLIQIKCIEFSEFHAQDFMNEMMLLGKITPRTFNNKLIDYRMFFNFLVKHRYLTFNPFKSVDVIPQEEKKLIPFSIAQARIYSDYLLKNDPKFYVASMLCYYCGIRPNEIVQLQIKDIRMEHRLFDISPKVSKNRKQRIIPIADVFWDRLMNHIQDFHPDMYIVSRGFGPGDKKIAPTRIAEHFGRIRMILDFPAELKFYSLKDTCAENLDYAGFSTKTIRDLFGHSSIAVTDAYMRRVSPRALEDLRNKFPEFGK